MGIKNGTEQDLVNACLLLLRVRGFHVWRQNQGGVAAEYKGKKRFVRFSHAPGISDIIGHSRRGTFIAIECKVPGRHATTDQQRFLDDVRAKGGIAGVVHSIAELEALIQEEGGT